MKAKKWITWLCAAVLLAQALFAGAPGLALEAQAAEAAPSDTGNIYYYDLADGNYFLSGGSITVNGKVTASGSELSVPGDYSVVKTFTDRNDQTVTLSQTVVLFKQGDASADGAYNIKDLVAMKKYEQGLEITKAGEQAIEAYTNKADITLLWDVLLGIKKIEDAFPRVGRPLSYEAGSNSVMPIGGFLGPGYLNPAVVTDIQSSALTDFRTDAIYSLIADAGINLIAATTNATASGESVEKVQQLELALAEKYGISMFVQPSYLAQVATNPEYFEQYLKELSGYDSFAGVALQDEPWTENYHPTNGSYTDSKGWSTHKVLAQMTNAYSNLTGYTNLLPYWSSMGSEDQYRAYLEEYFENYVNPKQIAFDYYVFSDGENVGGRNAAEYFTNLKLIKEAADKHNVPFWATVQAGNYVSGNIIRNSKDNAYMTDGMTRWTVHTALAYGAQGITYYPLVQPYNYALQKNILGMTTSTYNYDRNGIIGADGTTTPYYDQIKNVNQQILAVDQVLLNAVNCGLAVTEGTAAETDTGIANYGYEALQWLESTNAEKGAMAGCYKYYGQNAYYVVNYDYNAAQNITLHFNGDYTLSVTVNGKTELVNTTDQAYTLNLRAGDAALVLVHASEDAVAAQSVIAAIDAIPENAEMPKYYTAVVNAQAAYNALDKVGKASISAELTEKLNGLAELAASYGPLTGADSLDETYGPVTEYDLTNVTVIADSLHKADIPAQYGDVVFYVYNPGEAAVAAEYNGVAVTLNPGWTMVTVPVTAYGDGDNSLTFASAVSGLWKVTRYYGKNDAGLMERVQAAIDALPEAVNLSLAHEEQVQQVRAMYEALSADLQAHVNTAKLIACENKLAALKQELAGKLPLVIPNTSYGVAEEVVHAKDVYDETYEKVMTFADAGYFAIPASLLTQSYKDSKSAILYVYNPTEQDAYLGVQLGDNGWIHRDRVTLYAGKWTAVDLLDRGTTHTYETTSFTDNYLTSGEAIYFYAVDSSGQAATFSGEGWMVSGVYGMNEYKAGEHVVYDVVANEGLPGTKTGYEIVADDNFGSVFAFESTGYFVLSAEMKSKEFKACQDVAFYIYNPTDNWVTGNVVAGGGYTNYVALRPNSWNRIVLANYAGTEGSQFLTNGYTIEFNLNLPKTENGAKWKLTNFYGTLNLASSAADVNALITALPEADVIGGSHRSAVNEVKAAYDALPESEQAKVENVAKLDACAAKVAQWEAYDAKTVISATTASVAPYADDNTFGIAWTPEAGSGHVVIGSQDAAYAACEAIEFYIYNPTDTQVSGFIQNDVDWSNNGNLTLEPKAWTKVTVDQAVVGGKNVLSADVKLYVYVSFTGEGWKMSSVFGLSAADIEAEAIAGLNETVAALPAADAIGGSHKAAILEAKKSYDALSVAGQGQIEDHAKLEACAAKVAQWDAYDAKTVISATTASVAPYADDNTFGIAWTPEAGSEYVVIGSQDAAYADCEAIEFYLYNGTDAAAHGFVQDNSEWNNVAVYDLAPNAWTKVTINQATLKSGKKVLSSDVKLYVYVKNAQSWKMSGVFCVSAAELEMQAIAAVEAKIAALPETDAIGDSSRAAITEAKAAYDALSANAQAKVENAQKLTDCLAQVAQWDAYAAKVVLDGNGAVVMPTPNETAAVTQNVDDSTFGLAHAVTGGENLFIHNAYLGDAVDFYVYNPTNSDVSSYFVINTDWGASQSVTLTANAWTCVHVEWAKLVATKGHMYFYAAMDGDGWKISNVYQSQVIDLDADAAAPVIAQIAALPEANAVTDTHRAAIAEAKAAYDALSANAQAKVENAQKLTDCLAKVAYWDEMAAKTAIVWDAVVTPAVQHRDASVTPGVTIDVQDNTFGKAIAISNATHLFIHSAYISEADEFYIYNPTDSDVSAYYVVDSNWGVSKSVTLSANSWTCVHMEWQQLVATAGHIYFYANIGNEGWMITDLYRAEKQDLEAEAIAALNAQIAALPEANALGGSNTDKVNAAKAAFDALSEAGQARVENVEKLNACVAKVDTWAKLGGKIVVDAAYQTLGADGTLTVGVDNNTFGSVYTVSGGTYVAVTPNVKTENPAFKASKNIGFYIYNPTDNDVEGYYTMDWGYNEYFLLKAKSWNYVEFADFGADSGKQMISSDATIYFYAAFAGEGWMISSMYSQDADVEGLTMVVDASWQTLGNNGTLTINVDDVDFGKVSTVSNATFVAVTPNVMQENSAYGQSKAIVFYIYNPTDTDIDGNYTIDWGYYGYFQLKANSWNRIVISDVGTADNKKIITNGGTVYFYAAMNGEGWKVSSFYAVPEFE